MDLIFSLFPIFFGLVVLLTVARVVQFFSLPTFRQYQERHPEAVDRRGGVRCCHCGSSSIHVWWLWGPQTGGPKKHLCRHCGRALYRS